METSRILLPATVTPAAAILRVNDTVRLALEMNDASVNASHGRTSVWVSSDPAVASVSSGGLVQGLAPGNATVTGTSNGWSGRSLITVREYSAVEPGAGEPAYSAEQNSLILSDNFNQYSNFAAARAAYPANRGTEYMELAPGRGGTGNAVRLKYGIGGADDIVFGPETRLSAVGGWNGTLPRRAGPYTHFFFTTWFRVSPGSNPAENDVTGSGVKGFMFWHGSGRYQNAVNRLMQTGDNVRGPKGGTNLDNAKSGLNLYKTVDGRAPLWSDLADGDWHRFTIELYAGNDPSGHFGQRYWVDGALIYSDIDIRIGAGTPTNGYDYQYPITHWMVFGNFVNPAARSRFFTLDVDDWMAWTQ